MGTQKDTFVEGVCRLAVSADAVASEGLLYYHDVGGVFRAVVQNGGSGSDDTDACWRMLAAIFDLGPGGNSESDGRFGWIRRLFGQDAPPDLLLAAAAELADRTGSVRVRARLLGFLYEFATGREKFDLASRAVPDLVRAAEDFASQDGGSVAEDSLGRAGEIATEMKNDALRGHVWTAIESAADDPSARPAHFRWLLDVSGVALGLSKQDMGTQPARAVGKLRERLPKAVRHYEEGGNQHLARLCMASLESLARAAKDLEEAQAMAVSQVDSLIAEADREEGPGSPSGGGMANAILLDRAYQAARAALSRYPGSQDIRRRLRKLEVDIPRASSAARDSMKSHGGEFEIDLTPLHGAVEEVLSAKDAGERLGGLLAVSYVPDVEREEADARSGLEPFVFWRLAGMRVMEDGRFVATHDENSYPSLMANTYIRMKAAVVAQHVFANALRRMLAEELPGLDGLVATFVAYGLVRDSQAALLRAGLVAWRDSRPIEAVHLLVPRFEGAVREALAAHGVPVTRFRQGGAYHWQALDALLNAGGSKGVFPPGILRLFRVVMTIDGGLNLRNTVCHGYADEGNHCSEGAADLAAYCLFQMLRFGVLASARDSDAATAAEAPEAGRL